ncbi:MAG: hypothetical protein J6386_23395 [Candidatus Synoicihabitans palmerolidicus]|nr:hypothetical protein [Candidatus Synoicihabitans palmerolidicus]
MPDDRDDGTVKGEDGELERLRIEEDKQGRNDEGHAEEKQDVAGAVADVTDDFGEPDNVNPETNIDGPTGELAAYFSLESVGHGPVVETLAGGGIDLEKLGADDGPGKVIGDELAKFAGLDDVGFDLREVCRRRSEIGRDDVATGESVVDDFHVAHVRGDKGLHLGTVDSGDKKDLVGGMLERGEELRCKDVAMACHEGDDDAIGAPVAPPKSDSYCENVWM